MLYVRLARFIALLSSSAYVSISSFFIHKVSKARWAVFSPFPIPLLSAGTDCSTADQMKSAPLRLTFFCALLLSGHVGDFSSVSHFFLTTLLYFLYSLEFFFLRIDLFWSCRAFSSGFCLEKSNWFQQWVNIEAFKHWNGIICMRLPGRKRRGSLHGSGFTQI